MSRYSLDKIKQLLSDNITGDQAKEIQRNKHQEKPQSWKAKPKGAIHQSHDALIDSGIEKFYGKKRQSDRDNGQEPPNDILPYMANHILHFQRDL
jgi:hypothetical protein